MGNPDEVSFGSWHVTRVGPGSPAPRDTVVQVRLTRADLVLLDDQGRSLGTWMVDQVSFDVYGNDNGALRLGSASLSMRSVERRRSRELRDAILERRPPLPPIEAQEVGAMTVRSPRGLVVGLAIALVIPVSYWVLAQLVEHGIAPYDQTHSLLGPLGTIALSEVVLGPIGIGIAGWSAGVRSALAWLAVIVLGLPALAVVWFLCVVTLSGALGNPF
jgi:hypothetical protein